MQNTYFDHMEVTATHLVRQARGVLDAVIHRGEAAIITRHGRPAALLRRTGGVSRAEILQRLAAVRFSPEEAAELRREMDAAAAVIEP